MQIRSIPAQKVAELIGARYVGPAKLMITGLNEIHRVQEGDCVFVDHPKYYDNALNSAASCVIINAEVPCPEGKGLLVHDQPFSAFNQLARHFNPPAFSHISIAASARIATSAVIMPGCFIGENVIIGERTVLHPNVVVYNNCTIGNNVVVHANSTIGSDAFYFKKREEKFEPLYSCGTVVIEDDVVLGASCTIDRGVTAETRIGRGSVLDNQIHVGHDVIIGKMCLFAAQTGIAGACTFGDKVTVWGQVGFSSGLHIGDGATVLAQSGVATDIPAGKTYFGTPAGEARQKMREVAALKQLPGIIPNLPK